MAKEKPEVELKRLLAEQAQTMQDEVFGGLSPKERAAFDAKTARINQLEMELTPSAAGKRSSQSAKA